MLVLPALLAASSALAFPGTYELVPGWPMDLGKIGVRHVCHAVFASKRAMCLLGPSRTRLQLHPSALYTVRSQ